MTFSSSTISTAERRAGAVLRRGLLIAALVLATVPLPGHAEGEPTGALIASARQALVRGDGIDAEAKLRAALRRGVRKEAIAAFMGGAYVRQNDRERARAWLAPGRFTPDTAAEGFRVLAQLEQLDGNLPAAGKAYDRALDFTPKDAGLWVEIGRLRYRGGQHLLAIAAADHALALEPANVRALEFRGQLVRDRYGLLAALPWFETALLRAPADVSLLSEYAATLGELGRASEMLVVTRRILQLNPGNPRAYYLQAVMAARAGRYDLARGLLARTKRKLKDVPGAILLGAVVELGAGNGRTASDLCERLLQREPGSIPARELLARALYVSGQFRYLTLRFKGDVARDDAPAYLLATVARGFEALGDRGQAGILLDRAAMPQRTSLRVVSEGSQVGALLGQGRLAEALALAERTRAAEPGAYAAQAIAGDAQLAAGRAREAQERYALAARIRMSDGLLLRRFEAYSAAGDWQGAGEMVQAWLQQNPRSPAALRLRAMLLARAGDQARAAQLLDYLRHGDGDSDVQLLSDLALLQLGAGEAEAARTTATRAYVLQRANPQAAQALGLAYTELGVQRARAAALIDKARRMLGDNPLLADARRKLRLTPG